jgi:hypothetical protein
MPVYHIQAFDVSAIQIDLSANFFSATSLQADYWVDISINFDSYIGFNNALNNRFRQFARDGDAQSAIVRKSATRSSTPGTTIVTDVFLKDLGVIKPDGVSLYSSAIYSNITTLTASASNAAGSFLKKIDDVLVTTTIITNLRERMMASINDSTGSDLGVDATTPINSKFGFLIVRILNLAGTSQDQTINIACILTQDPLY